MVEQDYEILPHQLLQDLKYEVEALKKKLSQPDSKTTELVLEMESLKDNLHDLNDTFKKALDESKGDDIGGSLKSLKEKVDTVVAQNETIAKAMITISDKVEDFIQSQKMAQPKTAPGPMPQHVMGQPQMMGPGRMAPPPSMSNFPSFGAEMEVPPPPPGMGKRKGLF
ncbi:hypothetical protein J4437_06290 [Candidatus Woesearchaeota archaeon]|nr:hypothetical protein [Candidatus Woesearchaeota archaeon]